MSEFTVRADSLVARIESGPADAELDHELEALRELWRTLSEDERAQASVEMISFRGNGSS